MRFYKGLVHLSVLVCVIITVYVFQTDNSSITINIFREHSNEILSSKHNDTSHKTFSATLSNINVKPSKNNTSVNSLLKHNVWCIFTKVKHKNVPLRYKFERFINSLLKHSSIVITLNVISDNYSQIIAESVIKKSMLDSGKIIKSVYHDVINITESISNLTSIMQPAFSPQRGGYYSDALFYISLGLYELTDPEQINAVMLDVDVEFRADIALLFKQFDSFSDTELLGLAPELSPVYQHVLYLYRSHHNGTKFGSPLTSGGFPGLNSGVILFRFDKIRTSSLYKSLMTKDAVSSLMAKYSFMGHLGDQDMYTLMKIEHPELIHILPCGWNRQLCKWWRDHGYPDVFDSFAHCNEPVKLYHGNCNSPIPRQISVSNRL